ncbi:Conserved domain protein [Desulfitobacterium hafniense]|uniref:Conserved domain protein n=1 Tax=Desulfitobacterium hafniense TaxID=49338 RepID=A0A098AU84_DESHA|nr:hypothetical protein [Desulfitobacterium hafniense]CDV96345.1 Conserved domain protein [Desulfitobacterium hafniense]
MTIRSGFFNSVSGDRKYDAGKFAEYFASFIGNGVFPNPSTGLQVAANDDMTITVKAGKAWIKGYILVNDDDYILNLDPADGVLNRIDRIVARYDTVDREIRLEVKKGAFASSPVAPALQRDADAYELALADIAVNKGAISITQASITDLRLNTSLCGIVHGTVDQVDTTTLATQYQTWLTETQTEAETNIDDMMDGLQNVWDTWFATIQGALDGDVAGNLLNLINANTAAIATKAEQSDLANLQGVVAVHLADYAYQVAGGTATALTLTISGALVDGYPMTFIAAADNEAAATTINTKPLYKPNTTDAPNLVTGKAYTVWYDEGDDCFFIKASAEGDATVADVLAGKIFSNGDDTGLVGILALIGTSLVGDVVKGKTFYNTDAKTIQTGTGANAKRIASGTTTATVTAYGSGYKLSYSGLTFKPALVFAFQYSEIYDLTIVSVISPANFAYQMQFNNGAGHIAANYLFFDGGFDLQVNSGGWPYRWVAVEE